MATFEEKHEIRLALFQGANPAGFSGAVREAYLEVLADTGYSGDWFPRIPFHTPDHGGTYGAANWFYNE